MASGAQMMQAGLKSQLKMCILENGKFWTFLYLVYTIHLAYYMAQNEPENMETLYWVIFSVCILATIGFIAWWNYKTI